jgi:hypothetical protein
MSAEKTESISCAMTHTHQDSDEPTVFESETLMAESSTLIT